jgi:hypothetical protein
MVDFGCRLLDLLPHDAVIGNHSGQQPRRVTIEKGVVEVKKKGPPESGGPKRKIPNLSIVNFS